MAKEEAMACRMCGSEIEYDGQLCFATQQRTECRPATRPTPAEGPQCRHDAKWIADFTDWVIRAHEQRGAVPALQATGEPHQHSFYLQQGSTCRCGASRGATGEPPDDHTPQMTIDGPHCQQCLEQMERTGVDTNDEQAIRALHSLFFVMDRLDIMAWEDRPDGMVKVTQAMWRDQISPNVQVVRNALARNG